MFGLSALPRRAITITAFHRFTATATLGHSSFTTTTKTMGVTKTIIKEGNGPIPVKGQTVSMEYTGWLKEANGSKGAEFDSSIPRRRDLETKIGVGQVIRGWDEAILTMRVGEKATLHITSDYAYGERGFPGAIPENSDLIFDVELKKIA